MGSFLYALIIYPIEIFIESVFTISMKMIPSAGYAIVFVSIAVQLLVLPMYKRADELQDEERQRQKEMSPYVKHIKKTFHGDERVMMLSAYYRLENYHMYYQLKAILPLLLQIPFFMAAYNFLSGCPALANASFYFLKDMGRPDEMVKVGGFAINVMPIAMTLINIVSGAIYTRGLELKDKLQLYITAAVFLVLLYDSPSGLVFYWTLNNVFSLLKNIFMKLVKNPGPIISVASILFAAFYCYKCYGYGSISTQSGIIVCSIILIAAFAPAVGLILDRFRKNEPDVCITQSDTLIYRVAGLICAVTMGFLIPIATIASSPTEFVIRGHYVNPIVNVLYSFVVALGIFVLWGNLIFAFAKDRTKRLICPLMFGASVCGVINSTFFKQGLSFMSMNMQYNVVVAYKIKEQLINLLLLTGVVIICIVVFRYGRKVLTPLAISILAVVITMSGYNTYKVQKTLNSTAHLKDDAYYTEGNAHFTMDKKGKNVLVFMIDRSFGQYIPYIMNEKPELEKVYSGFTFYPNTISHGIHTQVGTPALFGGYDYTTYNVRNKSHDEYYDYIQDSLKVLPRLFSENGYKCTVFDPPHSVIDLENSSLEEFYHEISPDISAFYGDGVTKTSEEAERDYDYLEYAARKNYIRHSIFLSSPLLLRSWLYDDGAYLMQERMDDRLTFAGHIEELDKLPEMSVITDSGDNTFTVIENDVTHDENVKLQLPDYTYEDKVDNSSLYWKWTEKLSDTPGGRSINMYTDLQIQSYGVNMAMLISIGKWLDYLKENDLYDNTRIIIVGDHGANYFAFDDMLVDLDGEITDLEVFTPLLMVKDFGDGDFITSDEFMTNADVPTIAMEGLIKDPVNPYTKNPINSNVKQERDQYVFDNSKWLSIHDNIYDPANWDVVDIDYSNTSIGQ